jgi:hypothetical protein
MGNLSIKEVKAKYQDEIMKIPGVVGMGIGGTEEKMVLTIMVSKRTAEIETKLPLSLDNYPVVIEETGTFRAL